MADQLGGAAAPVPVETGSDDWNTEQRDETPLVAAVWAVIPLSTLR